MINGLYEAHLPVKNLKTAIDFYKELGLVVDHIVDDKIAFFWIVEQKSWLGLWQATQAELPYHPSIRHIAFSVELTDLKNAVNWLQHRGIAPREAFGFAPIEPFVIANEMGAHAKIHFNDPDGNSLEFITPLLNPKKITGMYYLSEWEAMHSVEK